MEISSFARVVCDSVCQHELLSSCSTTSCSTRRSKYFRMVNLRKKHFKYPCSSSVVLKMETQLSFDLVHLLRNDLLLLRLISIFYTHK